MSTLGPLYKLSKTGAVLEWLIEIDAIYGKHRTISGQQGGGLTASEWTQCKPKNVGKSHQTSEAQQAFAEAQAKYQKKLDEGYAVKIEDANSWKSPMLAYEYSKVTEKKALCFPVYSQPKLDGMRCIVTKDGMFSRNGKKVLSAPHVRESLQSLFDFDETIELDGELFKHTESEKGMEIELTKGMKALVSPEDYEELSQYTWHIANRYASRVLPRNGTDQRHIYMHREIIGAPDGIDVDHKNGNPLDNRRSNLRLCSVSQNIANSGPRPSVSGLKGVNFFKRDNNWQAQITVNYKKIHLGYFSTPEAAAAAYDQAALKYFGPFAYLNTPKAGESFNKLISLVKKSKPTAEDLEASKVVEYLVYDIRSPKLSFTDRFNLLTQIRKNHFKPYGCLRQVYTAKVTNQKDLDDYYAQYMADGFEGQMVRSAEGKYEFNRSNHLLKRKEMITEEFEIIDVIEGIGNRSGIAGSVLMKGPYSNFNSSIIGSHVFCRELLEDKHKAVGKLGTVKFQNWTPGDKPVPRFPELVTIRDYE